MLKDLILSTTTSECIVVSHKKEARAPLVVGNVGGLRACAVMEVGKGNYRIRQYS